MAEGGCSAGLGGWSCNCKRKKLGAGVWPLSSRFIIITMMALCHSVPWLVRAATRLFLY